MSTQTQLLNNIDIETIAKTITQAGYIIIQNALPDRLMKELYHRITSLNTADLKDARIGQTSTSKIMKDIRGDKTYWLDNEHDIDQHYLLIMDNLRSQLNKHLFLGLFEYESHYAIYEPGSYYKKHIDVLEGIAGSRLNKKQIANKNRVLSSVLYLNKNWVNQYGGELILYDKHNGSIIETVYPESGSLVLFLSEQFPHEVKTTIQTRYSITGWFRVNN